jgi:hypothetical protein
VDWQKVLTNLKQVADSIVNGLAAIADSTYGFFGITEGFFSDLIVACAGAFGGAWAAYRLGWRDIERRAAVAEIGRTNQVISQLVFLSNQIIAFRRQLFDPTFATFIEARENFRSAYVNARPDDLGHPPEIPVLFDLKTFHDLTLMNEHTLITVHKEISAPAKSYALINSLHQSCVSFIELNRRRNQFIERFRARTGTDTAKAFAYFGLETSRGVDLEYCDTMHHMRDEINNITFFAVKLIESLVEHGEDIRHVAKRVVGRAALPLLHPNFDKAREQGLIPPDVDYEGYLAALEKAGSK